MSQRRQQLSRLRYDAGDHYVTRSRDVARSRAVDVPGGGQGVLHAGRGALSVRQSALSGGVHVVDVSRTETQRYVQHVRAADHLLHAQEPGQRRQCAVRGPGGGPRKLILFLRIRRFSIDIRS